MNDPTPHYVLQVQANRYEGFGQWRFVLRPVDGSQTIEVADIEPNIWGERLDLLTVIRALESLDQPSRVAVVGCTRYVRQGIEHGLDEWRDNDWRWEWFGQMIPVRDADLWQRMDRILHIHKVECGQRRFDAAHTSLASPHLGGTCTKTIEKWAGRIAGGNWVKYTAPALVALCGLWMETASRFWHMGVRMIAEHSSSFLIHRS
jgi:ribonuclease HI